MHFEEDFCRVEDENVQQNLNIVRKIALNALNLFKEKKKLKRPLSKIMFDCLLEPQFLLSVLVPLKIDFRVFFRLQGYAIPFVACRKISTFLLIEFSLKKSITYG